MTATTLNSIAIILLAISSIFCSIEIRNLAKKDEIKDDLNSHIECEKHGKCSSVSFIYNNETLWKICFRCYGEKITEGLKNYK